MWFLYMIDFYAETWYIINKKGEKNVIKQVELKRFKKFDHSIINLNEFSVLVGENSSGKTTVLQSINLALCAFSRWKLYTTESDGITKPRRKGVGCTQLPGILNDDFRELYYGKKSRNSRVNGNSIGAEIYLSDEFGNKFGMQVSSLFGGYNLTPLSKSESINKNPTIHNKEALLISGFVGLASSEEKALSLALRNRLRDGRASEIIRNLLLDTKENVPENYKKLVARLKNDFGFEIDDVSFNEDSDINVHAYYDELINNNRIPFDFCSSGSGMMQVLQILTSIYRYCPENAAVVLLDEPDAHLHANMQVALFYSLREIQKELNIQILISTHSTAIISAAQPHEIIPISNRLNIEPLTNDEEVDDIVSERIDSYELSKMKVNGVLAFFEDKNIDYFLKCDQLLNTRCLIGARTVASLKGRSKDDKLPFQIKPVLRELLGRDISVFVVRDRDGLSHDVIECIENYAEDCSIYYHFLSNYEIESYLLCPQLILRTLESLNPQKSIPTENEIMQKTCELLRDTIRLSKYKYNTVLEDCLCKLSSFDGLELYRSSNEYRRKADKIREENESFSDFENLQRVGMGKECLRQLMSWINDELHLKISKKELINQLTVDDIPKEISDFLWAIKHAMN